MQKPLRRMFIAEMKLTLRTNAFIGNDDNEVGYSETLSTHSVQMVKYSDRTTRGRIKIDHLDVTCFIISLFTARHISNVSTSIFRSLRLIVDLFHVLYCSGSMCVGVTVWFGWGGVVSLCRLKH